MSWRLIVYSLAQNGIELEPLVYLDRFNDYISCSIMQTALTTAMQAGEFVGFYLVLCVNQ